MKLKDWFLKITGRAQKEHDPLAVLDKLPGVRNLDAEDELARRAEANARGAALRGERAAFWSEVLDGRSRWIRRRHDWLAPRPRKW